jgi:hypothetical protein
LRRTLGEQRAQQFFSQRGLHLAASKPEVVVSDVVGVEATPRLPSDVRNDATPCDPR